MLARKPNTLRSEAGVLSPDRAALLIKKKGVHALEE